MRSRGFQAWMLFAGLGLLAGCSKPTDSMSGPEVPGAGEAARDVELGEPSPAPAGQMEDPSDSEEVTLQILEWDEIGNLVRGHVGKVVVMDLWATYCPPCVAEFPHLVQLHREFPDQVRCVSVSLDYDGLDDEPVETYRDKALAFLKRQGATFDNVLCATPAEEVFNTKIEHNSIPVVFVFDRAGNLAGQFPDPQNPDEFTYQAHVLPVVRKLAADE